MIMSNTSVKIDGVQWSKYYLSADKCITKIFEKIIVAENDKMIKKIILEIEK